MKCVKYWPNTQTLLGPYQIRMERQNTSRRYILRHIKIKKVVVYFIYLLTILCEIFEKKTLNGYYTQIPTKSVDYL